MHLKGINRCSRCHKSLPIFEGSSAIVADRKMAWWSQKWGFYLVSLWGFSFGVVKEIRSVWVLMLTCSFSWVSVVFIRVAVKKHHVWPQLLDWIHKAAANVGRVFCVCSLPLLGCGPRIPWMQGNKFYDTWLAFNLGRLAFKINYINAAYAFALVLRVSI